MWKLLANLLRKKPDTASNQPEKTKPILNEIFTKSITIETKDGLVAEIDCGSPVERTDEELAELRELRRRAAETQHIAKELGWIKD